MLDGCAFRRELPRVLDGWPIRGESDSVYEILTKIWTRYVV